jgi:hypothetical protein
VARPVLGRRPDGLTHFREFRSEPELLRLGFVPVRHYRVCDCWDDYHTPWSFLAAEQPTDPHDHDSSLPAPSKSPGK